MYLTVLQIKAFLHFFFIRNKCDRFTSQSKWLLHHSISIFFSKTLVKVGASMRAQSTCYVHCIITWENALKWNTADWRYVENSTQNYYADVTHRFFSFLLLFQTFFLLLSIFISIHYLCWAYSIAGGLKKQKEKL